MEKIDLRRELAHLYRPRAGKFTQVEVPELGYLAVSGAIEPGRSPGDSTQFQGAVEALYGLAYTLRFALKKQGLDAPVMPLEGQWWVTDGDFDLAHPDNWGFRLLIAVPDPVGHPEVDAALKAIQGKRPNDPWVERLGLIRFAEGTCVQVLHIGPFATEPQTLAGMAPFLDEHGLVDLVGPEGGRHHEIYLSDPRRTAPERLRTVLRHPTRPR